MKKTVIVLIFAISGCAHGVMRGSVVMKTSDNEAHVCLGEGEVKSGDRVNLFKHVCKDDLMDDSGITSQTCVKILLGSGTVERTLNQHYSLVKIDGGVPFQEGTVVEKQ